MCEVEVCMLVVMWAWGMIHHALRAMADFLFSAYDLSHEVVCEAAATYDAILQGVGATIGSQCMESRGRSRLVREAFAARNAMRTMPMRRQRGGGGVVLRQGE